jgi:hypothetical protein
MEITFDKLFTYWTVVWFIIYYFTKYFHIFGDIKYNIPSPIIALYIGLIENLCTFILFFINNVDFIEWIKFALQISITKGFPIYLLRNEPLKIPENIYSFLFVFIVYLLYLQILGTNIIDVYRQSKNSLIKGKHDTPMYKFINGLSGYFSK